MFINSFKLSGFKNLANLEVRFNTGFHFITGSNGCGKTNFLDALYYVCMTKSFLKTPDRMLIKFGEEFMRLEAEIETGQQLCHLKIKLKNPLTKEIIYDGKRIDKLHEYLGAVKVVIVAPDEVYTLMNIPEERRRFLNQTLVQSDPEYTSCLFDYNKLLKQRIAALRNMKKEGKIDHALLDAIDHTMQSPAAYIFEKRDELVESLNPAIQHYVKIISGHNQISSLEYHSDLAKDFKEVLRHSREKDFYSQRCNYGIHKDRLVCRLNEQVLNETGSQGQMKTFVIAMKIAQFNYLRSKSGSTPLVLLDDIFAKLDQERVNKFLELLIDERIEQCFITDTHRYRGEELKNKISGSGYLYEIHHGNLQQL